MARRVMFIFCAMCHRDTVHKDVGKHENMTVLECMYCGFQWFYDEINGSFGRLILLPEIE